MGDSKAKSGNETSESVPAERLKQAVAASDAEAIAALAREPLPKHLRKELRRAVHRLRSAGVQIDLPAGSGGAVHRPAQGKARVEAHLSAVDGAGGRLLWLVADSPSGGRDVVSVYLDDVRGLKAIHGGHSTRKKARQMMAQVHSHPEVPTVPIDPALGRAIVEEAERRTRESGGALPEHYAALHSMLGDFPAAAALESHPARILAEDLDERRLVELARGSANILERGPMRAWTPSREKLREIVQRIEGIEASKVIVSPAQQLEQIDLIFQRAAGELLEDEGRERWARRLLDTAWVLHLRGEKELAVRLVEIAQAVERRREEVPAFIFELVRRPFTGYLERRFAEGGEGESGKRVGQTPEGSPGKGKLIVPGS